MAAKTEELPGVEGEGVSVKKIKRLDNAITAWRGFVEERMALTESEVAARDKVVSIMHEEGITKYPYWASDDEQKLVVLDKTEKLKLKNAASAEADESGKDDPDDE